MNHSKQHKSGKKSGGSAQPAKAVKPAVKNHTVSTSGTRVAVDELFLHFTANIIKEDTLFTR